MVAVVALGESAVGHGPGSAGELDGMTAQTSRALFGGELAAVASARAGESFQVRV